MEKTTNNNNGTITGKNPIKPGRIERFALAVSDWAGSTWSFFSALLLVLAWAVTGPLFNFSTTWQLVINTGTTIITFLMVFLIQKSQNKEAMVVQLKLNELIAAMKGASNRLVNIEALSEEDLKTLKDFYCILSEKAANEQDLKKTHSIEEAKDLHEKKMKYRDSEE